MSIPRKWRKGTAHWSQHCFEIECSNCFYEPTLFWSGGPSRLTRKCPKCGALMQNPRPAIWSIIAGGIRAIRRYVRDGFI